MGTVYLAEDTKLHRKVSLKFLSTNFTQDHERLRRFEQEARAAIAIVAMVLMAIATAIVVYAWRMKHTAVAAAMRVVPFTSYPGDEVGAAFSPDGNQIAFIWGGEKNDNVDIYVKSIGTERPLRLTTDPGVDYEPTWSPDGQTIAFLRDSGSEFAIFMVPALCGSERKLLSLGPKVNWGGWAPDINWSPDGKFIAYSDKGSKQDAPGIFLFYQWSGLVAGWP